MTQVPALRAALQDAAQRRYGRRRRMSLVVAVPIVGIVGAAGLVLLPFRSPERETVAGRTPAPSVRTVKVVPIPSPQPMSGKPLIVDARVLHDDAQRIFEAEVGTSRDTLERAWTVPEMQGQDAHVFLFNRGERRCLSVPDPSTAESGDRSVTCASPAVFERFGVSVTVGSNYAAVVPDPERRPTYRHADGTREPLEPIGGLVALARTDSGSAVWLTAPDGERRVDALDADQRRSNAPISRYECSNGEVVIGPSTMPANRDPCAEMAANEASTWVLPGDRRARGD